MQTKKLTPIPSPVTSVIMMSVSQSVSVASTVTETSLVDMSLNNSDDNLLESAPENKEEVVDSSVDLLSPSVLTLIFVKSCSRCNFAAKLVAKLFDNETRR